MTFVVSFYQLLSTYCKQYRPRSDYFLESRLIMVHIVCRPLRLANIHQMIQSTQKYIKLLRSQVHKFDHQLFYTIFIALKNSSHIVYFSCFLVITFDLRNRKKSSKGIKLLLLSSVIIGNNFISAIFLFHTIILKKKR